MTTLIRRAGSHGSTSATALEHELPLVTRNEADFKHVAGLRFVNPFAPAP